MAEEKKRKFDVLSFDSSQQYENEQKKKHNNSRSSFVLPEGVEFFRFPEDQAFIHIDILPFVTTVNGREMLMPRLPYAVHRCSLSQGFRQYICPREYEGEDCPICAVWNAYKQVMDWQDPEQVEYQKKMRPQLRQLYNIRWLNAPVEDQDKIWILDTSAFNFGKLLDAKIGGRDMTDPDEAKWDRYADLFEGYQLKLTLTPTTWKNTKYIQVTAIDLKERKQQHYDESWYDRIPDLTKVIQKASLADLQQAANELDPRNARYGQPGDQAADDSQGDASFDPNVIERPDVSDNDGSVPW